MTTEYDIRKFDRIAKMRKEGFWWDEIEEYFYNSDGSAKKFYYAYKPDRRATRPLVTTEFKQKVKELRNEGLSYSQIGAKLGTTRNAISGLVYRWKL